MATFRMFEYSNNEVNRPFTRQLLNNFWGGFLENHKQFLGRGSKMNCFFFKKGGVVVVVALIFNNQVNNNFQYKLLKLFEASKVRFHSSIESFCKSAHNFCSAANTDYLRYVNHIHLW